MAVLSLILLLLIVFLIFLKNRVQVIHYQRFWSSRGFSFISKSKALIAYKQKKSQVNKKFFKDWDQIYYTIYHEQGVKIGAVDSIQGKTLLATDIDLIKTIMANDFNHFKITRLRTEPKSNQLLWKMLSFTYGQEWENLRQILSPIFSPSKIKSYFPKLLNVSDNLVKLISQVPTQDISDCSSRYTIDALTAVLYGYEANSLFDSTSPFYVLSLKNIKMSWSKIAKNLIQMYLPEGVKNYFGISVLHQEFLNFGKTCAEDAIQRRQLEDSSFIRQDILEYLLKQETKSANGLTRDQTVAQLFGFFMSGFDAVSAVLGIACINIAYHPLVQERLARELEIAVKNNGVETVTEALMNVEYLRNVIFETLRMYPPATRTERICTEEYTIPGLDVKIPIGTQVIIPLFAIQNNPEYWDEPNKFKPSRFENTRSNKYFMAYGDGRRNCIGSNLAMAEIKLAIAKLVLNFEIRLQDEERDIASTIRQAVHSFKVRSGVILKFIPRK